MKQDQKNGMVLGTTSNLAPTPRHSTDFSSSELLLMLIHFRSLTVLAEFRLSGEVRSVWSSRCASLKCVGRTVDLSQAEAFDQGEGGPNSSGLRQATGL